MDRQEILIELKNLIESVLKEQGLELIDLIYRYEGRDLILRVLADKPEGGISLGECARLNNEITKILDEKDILKERYILEVSSPGIDRPLVEKGDFLRCIDRNVRFYFSEPINGKVELKGTIIKADDDAVYIDIEDKTIAIPLSKIKKAKQVVDVA